MGSPFTDTLWALSRENVTLNIDAPLPSGICLYPGTGLCREHGLRSSRWVWETIYRCKTGTTGGKHVIKYINYEQCVITIAF